MLGTVAHVTPWGIPCGVAKHLSYWLASVSADWDSVILADHPPPWYGPPEDTEGWPVDRCWNRSRAESLPDIQAAVESCRAKIVHWQWDPSFFPYRAILAYGEWAADTGVRTVATLHTLEDIDVFAFQNQSMLRVVDQVVVGTPGMADAWTAYAKRFHIRLARPIRVIPLPVPPVPPTPAPKATPAPLVLTWGMLGHGKGHETVLEAVKLLRQGDYPEARYLVVGRALTGEQKQHLADLEKLAATEDALELRVDWPSEQDIYALCGSAHAIALNHQWQHESSSGTVALSVASGTPVVVSVSPMFSGYEGAVRVAGDTAQAWANALADAIGQPEQFAAGRAEVLRRITGAAVAAQYEQIYSSLLVASYQDPADAAAVAEAIWGRPQPVPFQPKEVVMAGPQVELAARRKRAALAGMRVLLSQARYALEQDPNEHSRLNARDLFDAAIIMLDVFDQVEATPAEEIPA